MAEAALVEQMVDIGSTQLRLRYAGDGAPTVVLEAGLGEGLEAWTKAQTQVAAFTRVCAYDRAGVGKSSPGPEPRTSEQTVTELRELLDRAQIQGPYVLVGHSFGGLNAQLYAIEHPAEVVGVVLVDPLVVISAGQPVKLPPPLNTLFPGAKLVRVLQASHAALAMASSQGQHLIAEKSTHATIAQDDLIVDAIRQVVEMVR